MDEIMAALDQADVFCAIGTSGIVYPAAGFAAEARRNGRGCVLYEINPGPTGARYFDHVIAAPAGEGVPEFLRRLGVAEAD
jgi:NAD-dependent deacetylase